MKDKIDLMKKLMVTGQINQDWILENILNINKDSKEGNLYLNPQGLMKLEFSTGEIKSEYYMVQI
jgi:hypothetical protein